jgi:SAM-dependent methyltransferase
MVAISYRERRMTDHCPVCRSGSPIALERRARIPLLQNRAWPDRNTARAAPVGELDFALCAACGFTWNRAFIPGRVVYDPNYNNDQMGSPRFRAHVDAMVDRVVRRVPPRAAPHLVEVGCGQGAFLAELARKGRFASLTGFDPAWRGEDGLDCGGFAVHRRSLTADVIDCAPSDDVFVVARHTIEHVADPLSFLRTIRAAMGTAGGILFLETPGIEWIIESFQPHDLFYEHCSIFSRDALTIALSSTGFDPIAINRVFDGQYLWAEAQAAARETSIAGRCEFVAAAAAFADKREYFIRDWRQKLKQISCGNVYLWGAAAKGATFATLIDPDGERLAGTIDINPAKVGKFMPATGLPIVSPSILRNGDTVIAMNPNYRAEIASEIGAIGIAARLLTVDGGECAEQPT